MKLNVFLHWLDRIIRLVLGTLFIIAGILKLKDPESFSVVLSAFGVVPGYLIDPLAIGLPILEVLVGFGMIWDRPPALHAMALLLFMFMAILAYAMHLGLDIDCGCYGPKDPEAKAFGSLRTSFHRDLLMSVGILFLYARRIHAYFIFRQSHNPKEEML
ncbi:MAG: DoxX family membrane protein [Proteobacteria bacterium]|nr:DoxX family membrane protein [Pseudomonadota bacterium]